MAITNKKPKEEIKAEIEEVLEETPPVEENPMKVEDLLLKNPADLTAPEMDFLDEHKDDLTDEQQVQVGLKEGEDIKPEEKEEPPVSTIPESTPTPPEVITPTPAPPTPPVIPVEVKEVTEPTEDEIKAFVLAKGIVWDELTASEKITYGEVLKSNRRVDAITESIQTQKKATDWSKQIDTFIDGTANNPVFTKLSGHESEFKAYAMKEENQGIALETILLPAFLYNLPPVAPKRGNLFERGGGGEKETKPQDGIMDADMAAKLRVSDPREYKRQLRAGKIKIEVE